MAIRTSPYDVIIARHAEGTHINMGIGLNGQFWIQIGITQEGETDIKSPILTCEPEEAIEIAKAIIQTAIAIMRGDILPPVPTKES